MNTTNFSVPNPCNEDWNAMQPKESSRYCDSCQKVVIDFTNKSKEEIIDYINANKDKKLCGTFKNTALKPTTNENNEYIIRFVVALLLVFGMCLFSCSSVYLGDKPNQFIEDETYQITTGEPILSTIYNDTLQSETTKAKHKNNYNKEEIIEDFTTTGVVEVDAPPALDSTIENVVLIEIPDTSIFPDVAPEFPGGQSEMLKYVRDNYKIPVDADCSYGNIYITFVVLKDGSIDNVKLLKGIGKEYDEEAIRIIKAMPKWKPGKSNGKVTNTRINIPIRIHYK